MNWLNFIQFWLDKWPVKTTLIGLILGCCGCFGNGSYAPVVDRQDQPFRLNSDHVVSRGETLFSIAWRYDLDYRRLASANNIKYPYTIYPGQRLRLKESPSVTNTPRQASSSSHSSTAANNRSSTVNNSRDSKQKVPASQPMKGEDHQLLTGWRWPARGKLLHAFQAGSSTHKGIDIQGKFGEPVLAANNGTVVYAGSGLVGYGQLIIVRHDARYLSAYAHNSKLLVKEGERVKAGQQIAKIGDSGTDQTKLHFEIRLEGKPQDPLKILPK